MGARAGLVQKKVRVKTKRGVAMRTMWVKSNPKAAGAGRKPSLKSQGPMTAGQLIRKHGLGIVARGAATGAASLGGAVAGHHAGKKLGGYQGGEIGAAIGSFGAAHAASHGLYKKSKGGRAILSGLERGTMGARLTATALHTTAGLGTYLGGAYAAHKLSKRRRG